MSAAGLVRHRHPDPAFTIDLPADTEVGIMPGVLVVARAHEGASASPFRSNLTVVAQELPAGTDPDELSEASLAEAQTHLPDWRLLDRVADEIGGRVGERTLATYLVRRASGVDFGRRVSVAVEQWRLLQDDLVWILSASCETPEYGQWSDLWTTCARSFELGPAS